MTAPGAVLQKPAGPGGNAQKAAPLPMRPFVAGTRRVDKATYDQTKTLVTSTQDLPTYECDPNGFLRGTYILVEATTSANAATVTFAADGPFNVIDTITLNDTNNKPIFGPMGGHDFYEVYKFGGYTFMDDCKNNPASYSATTGAGGTGGSFSFCLRLPVELVPRDGLGSLINKSSSATFDINIRLAANATVYGTPPTSAPSVRTRIQQFGWMDPHNVDMQGNPVSQNPPGNNTTQYWAKQTYTIAAGAFSIRLQGVDSYVRNFLFQLVDNANSRTQGDADFPDPFSLQYETAIPVNRIRRVWQHMIVEDYGYTAAAEAANGRDNGVYPETYCRDFIPKPGWETRFGYLPVSSATTINLAGSIGGSGLHTLTVLVNKIVPANGDPLQLTGR
jgi:hypothetical protein